MRDWLRIILDTIFPPTAHERCLRSQSPTTFLRYYHPFPIKDCIALSNYEAPVVQAAIAATKFEKNLFAAELLSTLLHTWLAHHTVTGVTIIIPLPLSLARQKERGFNQVERVIRHLPRSAHYQIESRWLERPKDTLRQTSLDRTNRLQNMKGAFAVAAALQTADLSTVARIVICDDVITTGATLTEARNTIIPYLPPHITVVCIAWAH